MTTFAWITPQQNFLPRPCADEDAWEVNSDIVARVRVGSLDRRLVIPAAALRFRRLPRARKARAIAIRPEINALPVPQRVKDDLYLDALHADAYPHLRREKVKLRLLGRLRRPLSYDRMPK